MANQERSEKAVDSDLKREDDLEELTAEELRAISGGSLPPGTNNGSQPPRHVGPPTGPPQ